MKTHLKFQPVLTVLTLTNLAVLGVVISQSPALAAPESDGILRGRGLQIVDARGEVRASIAISPSTKLADGSIYPETVLLRLITSEGRPAAKLSASDDGAGLALSAATGDAYAQILAHGDAPRIAIVNGRGVETLQLP